MAMLRKKKGTFEENWLCRKIVDPSWTPPAGEVLQMTLAANQADSTFRIDGGSADELRGTAFAWREGLSEPFRFRVELCSDEAGLYLEAPLGHAPVQDSTPPRLRCKTGTGRAHDSSEGRSCGQGALMAESTMRQANETDFTFRIGDGSLEDLQVTGFSGSESMSELYRFRVRLCSEDGELDLDAQIGQTCSLEIAGRHGSRHVSGIVRRFARTGQGGRWTHYAAEIVPVHWLLTKRRRSRAYQDHNCPDMSVPGIIAQVFENAGIAPDSFRFALKRDYEPRDFVVQYRESDMNFIARLMEQEGLFYFFEHSADAHVMVIADSAVAHVEIPGQAEVPYRDPNGLHEDEEYVFRLEDQASVQLGAVTIDDFNFKQPAMQLRSNQAAGQFTALESVDYPGEFEQSAAGARYAQVRLEAQQARRRSVRLQAVARGMMPGFRFTLKEHRCDTANREYVITRVKHRGRQAQSAQEDHAGDDAANHLTEVWAIPADVPFRAQQTTRRPTVRGSQTGIVVGPAGEEIHTDEYGRIRVQFHWDQDGGYDENSSCWIRVSQGWAGGNYGMFFLPRIGQEVIVDFLEGNPDRPIVTGSVHNADNLPPYKLPDHKTRSTIKTNSSKGGEGTNEIRFEDAKDAEQLFFHAAKDLHTRVTNDRVESIGRDDHVIVQQHAYELVKQNKHAEVRLDLREKIGGDRIVEVAGDVGERFKSHHHEAVGGNYSLAADGKIVVESSTGICLKVGGNFITIDSSGIYVMGTVVHINSEGSALNGSTVAAAAPEAPLEAETTEPGTDVRYNADGWQFDPLTLDGSSGDDDDSDDEKQTSWIEIELVDEAGQPWPDERYEVIEPDGRKKSGRLDENGLAHVAVSDPGECQISFPDLDRRAWSRSLEPSSPASPDPDDPTAGSDDGSQTSPGSGSDSDSTRSSSEPDWLPVAQAEEGQQEISGSEDNPRVLEYLNSTTLKGTSYAAEDETAWCSAFVNWVMTQAGYAGTNNAQAISWANWGKRLDRPAYGAIAVFQWNPPDTSGHVGFVVGKSGSSIQVLGGNQDNRVKVTNYSTNSIIAYVVPADYEVPDEDYDLQPYSGAADSEGNSRESTR